MITLPETSEPRAFRTDPRRRFSVGRLTLTNFRCYRHQRIEADPDPVVLTGPNGAGKTSVLEALSFLAPGRGLRQARLEDVVRRPADAVPSDSWAVAARLATPGGPIDLGTGRDSDGKGDRRVVRIDGHAVRSQSELTRYLTVVWLTPEMDRLFLDGSPGRRRFLDRLVYGVDSAHAARVSAYERALRERSRLLRRPDPDAAWLSALEDVMATQGVAVAAARREVATRLARHAGRPKGPFPAAEVGVAGLVDDWLDGIPALAAEDRLRAALRSSRQADADSGGAACGPHRSDLHVRYLATGRPAAECSTGEQKALLIALVLAGARMHAEERGVAPLLLLDEVAAHLDDRRRGALFEMVSDLDAQTWYAGTDRGVFAPIEGRAQMFVIENAEIRSA